MQTITIKGEAGKAFGEREILFSEIAASGSLDFVSLGVDTLSFSIQPRFVDARETEIPEEGQSVSLFIDNERVFTGIVNRVPGSWGAGELVVNVTVSGAWWWLEENPLSEILQGDVERPSFRCALGQIEGHITRLFERVKTLGLPLDVGDLAECYEIPTTTFRNVSFSRAVSELIRQVPDAVGWWDYSGAGTPKFRLSRRNLETATTLTLGVDAVISGDLEAEFGLKISELIIPYAERLENGEVAFKEQRAGEGGGARQILTVSGPELAEFVPPDPIDGVTLSTVDVMLTETQIDPGKVRSLWPFWSDWVARHPAELIPAAKDLFAWSTAEVEPHTFYNGTVPRVYLEDGTPLSGTAENVHAVTYQPGATIPSWLDDLYEVQRGYIKGTFWTFQEDIPAGDPDWFLELMEEAAFIRTLQGGPDNGDRHLFFELEIPVVLLPTSLAALTVYKPLAYTFELPPEDFAKNLQSAQSWLPYNGTVTIETESFRRLTGETLNLAGGRSAWETMGALIQGESVDLSTWEHTLNLGSPPRFSGSTPVTRLERSPADNLVIL